LNAKIADRRPLGSRMVVKKLLSRKIARIRFAVGVGISLMPVKSVDLNIGREKMKSSA